MHCTGFLVDLHRRPRAQIHKLRHPNTFFGCIPNEIGMLKKKSVFDVSFNSLSRPLAVTVGGLKSVEKLDVAHNWLTEMAGLAMTPSVLSITSAPKIGYKSDPYEIRVRVAKERGFGSVCLGLGSCKGGITLKRVNAAGLSEIEPDLNEDYRDPYATNGISEEDFIYGEMDDHHTYHGEDEAAGTFWELVARDYAAVDPPSGFQGLISWLFLPAVAAGLYFDVPGEYLYIGAAIFTVVFCIIEMDKPSEAHNFEPQIYNMERSARDKLISDYNTMNIWEFNEKYGELWDFTKNNEDIIMKS